MAKKTERVIVNMLAGWGTIGIRGILALIMVPFLITRLGPAGYGIIGVLAVIISLSVVADMGLRQALGRELTEQLVNKDMPAFNELMNAALVLYMFVGTGIAIGAIILAPWIVNVSNIPSAFVDDTVVMIRSYGSASILISFVTPLFSAGLISYHRFDLVGLAQVAGDVFSSVVLLITLPLASNGLYCWGVCMTTGALLTLYISYRCFRRFGHRPKFGISHINLARLRPLFRLGGYMYAIEMTNTLSQRSDPLVISHFLGPIGVAVYQPGSKLSAMIRPIVLTLSRQMYPLAAEKHIGKELQKMQQILLLGTKYTFMFGALFCAGMFIWATPFCKLWLEGSLGGDYKVAAKVLMAFALIDLMTYAAGTQWAVLLGMRDLRFLTWTQVPSGILNVIISIYLVKYTSLGLIGVLFATILIGFIRRPILTWYTSKRCGLSLREYLRGSYIQPLCCLVITLAGSFALAKIFSPSSILSLATCMAGTCILWAVSVWTVGTGKFERATMLKQVPLNRYTKWIIKKI